jgi:hypothetical protein
MTWALKVRCPHGRWMVFELDDPPFEVVGCTCEIDARRPSRLQVWLEVRRLRRALKKEVRHDDSS